MNMTVHMHHWGIGKHFMGVWFSSYMSAYNFQSRCIGNLEHCSNGFSLALWLKIGEKSMASDSYYISSGAQTYASHGVALLVKGQALHCAFKKTTSKWKVSDYSVKQLVWYHVAVSWDIKIGARMYRDGILVSEAPTASTATYTPSGYDSLVLGRANNGLNKVATHGEGYIDELYLCEEFLQEKDIVYMYLSYLR